MANDPKKHEQPAGDLAVVTRPKLERARRYQVVFYNDDYTTKWFVVDVLERFFHMSEAMATAFMLVVHETGRGVAGVYTRDIAETKVEEVHEYARGFGMPLRLDIEPEDD
jgi:ATP-dependent Clp protease adaptor protein ClpS